MKSLLEEIDMSSRILEACAGESEKEYELANARMENERMREQLKSLVTKVNVYGRTGEVNDREEMLEEAKEAGEALGEAELEWDEESIETEDGDVKTEDEEERATEVSWSDDEPLMSDGAYKRRIKWREDEIGSPSSQSETGSPVPREEIRSPVSVAKMREFFEKRAAALTAGTSRGTSMAKEREGRELAEDSGDGDESEANDTDLGGISGVAV